MRFVKAGVLAVAALLTGAALNAASSESDPGGGARASQSETARLSGTLALLNRKGTKPSRTADPRAALVFYVPQASDAPFEPGSFAVKTEGKAFTPAVLAVPKGSTVRFPNGDPILHNVFSVSGENAFDLELYGRGEGRSTVFEHDGLVRIFCNVHKEMFANIWVLPTPFSVAPLSSGEFVLDGLPPGRGELTVWHQRAEPETLVIDLVAGDNRRDLELKITRPRVPFHLDKTGKPYRKRSDNYR